jgi:hypothetical protein
VEIFLAVDHVCKRITAATADRCRGRHALGTCPISGWGGGGGSHLCLRIRRNGIETHSHDCKHNRTIFWKRDISCDTIHVLRKYFLIVSSLQRFSLSVLTF